MSSESTELLSRKALKTLSGGGQQLSSPVAVDPEKRPKTKMPGWDDFCEYARQLACP
jgi:hypothetical protein